MTSKSNDGKEMSTPRVEKELRTDSGKEDDVDVLELPPRSRIHQTKNNRSLLRGVWGLVFLAAVLLAIVYWLWGDDLLAILHALVSNADNSRRTVG